MSADFSLCMSRNRKKGTTSMANNKRSICLCNEEAATEVGVSSSISANAERKSADLARTLHEPE